MLQKRVVLSCLGNLAAHDLGIKLISPPGELLSEGFPATAEAEMAGGRAGLFQTGDK